MRWVIHRHNQAPIANAGSDQSVSAVRRVTLNRHSQQRSGWSYAPELRLEAKPAAPAVSLTPSLSVTHFHRPRCFTILTFTLAVTDSFGLADRPRMRW